MKIPQLPKQYAHLQDKVTHYEESQYAPYEINGTVYSAYQRHEVVGRWEYFNNGVEYALTLPIRKWGKKEVEIDAEEQRKNKERLKEEYKAGRVGNKFARVHGLVDNDTKRSNSTKE